jgi:hypothetical protein
VHECKRVLRENGIVLIATANKDLYDFNPSPNSYEYYGVTELNKVFGDFGFTTEFYGYMDTSSLSLRQKILRPVKKIVVSSGLMPKTMAGKKLLKRFVFGKLETMPADISNVKINFKTPRKINAKISDINHKVIYCVAKKL